MKLQVEREFEITNNMIADRDRATEAGKHQIEMTHDRRKHSIDTHHENRRHAVDVATDLHKHMNPSRNRRFSSGRAKNGRDDIAG